MRNKLKKDWEQRSEKYKNDPRGVLPKAFPDLSLQYLDSWMYRQISAEIPKNKNIKILDLGCGYGRLAKQIEDNYPKSKVDGLDISDKYVKNFNDNVARGRAVSGDIVKLPYKSNSYDLVILVTTLMYLTDKEQQQKVINEIFRVLNKGGKLVLIESNYWGHQFMVLGGLVTKLRGVKNKEIDAVSFRRIELNSLLEQENASVRKVNGNSIFCLTIHLQYLLKFSPPLLKCLLKVVGMLEKKIRIFNNSLPMYWSIVATKN